MTSASVGRYQFFLVDGHEQLPLGILLCDEWREALVAI
jgi:hypothetical protein